MILDTILHSLVKQQDDIYFSCMDSLLKYSDGEIGEYLSIRLNEIFESNLALFVRKLQARSKDNKNYDPILNDLLCFYYDLYAFELDTNISKKEMSNDLMKLVNHHSLNSGEIRFVLSLIEKVIPNKKFIEDLYN